MRRAPPPPKIPRHQAFGRRASFTPGRFIVRSVLLFCLLAATAAPAAAQDYRFASIPWGSDGATVKRLMVAQEFVLEKADSDGDYLFKGHLAGYDASVWALMAKDALVKVDIILLTPDPKARQAYRDMKTLLTTKYGKSQAVEAFEKPYADGQSALLRHVAQDQRDRHERDRATDQRVPEPAGRLRVAPLGRGS
jgi:hypothetical protein